MDYYLSSAVIEAEGADAHYSEQLVRASTLLTYQYRVAPPPGKCVREGFGIASDQHVYLCPHQLGK